jgi:hypothetical protein
MLENIVSELYDIGQDKFNPIKDLLPEFFSVLNIPSHLEEQIEEIVRKYRTSGVELEEKANQVFQLLHVQRVIENYEDLEEGKRYQLEANFIYCGRWIRMSPVVEVTGKYHDHLHLKPSITSRDGDGGNFSSIFTKYSDYRSDGTEGPEDSNWWYCERLDEQE